MAKNFRDGPTWLPGVIVKQLGMLTFLVQLDNGQFWKHHGLPNSAITGLTSTF